jgi:hypothetical protein
MVWRFAMRRANLTASVLLSSSNDPKECPVPQANADKERGGARTTRRRWIALAAVVAVTVVAVVLVVLLARDDDRTGSQAAADTGAATQVTSPYDFAELPEDSGPAEVESASYVSILLADEAGALTAYGLDAGMPAALALKQAVMNAEEADSDLLASLPTFTSTASGATAQVGSTLTFVFADRGKLTFDLYVGQGLVGRGGRAWRVEGDLAVLIEAAAAAGQQ